MFESWSGRHPALAGMRKLLIIAGLAVLAGVLSLAAGCVNTIHPPADIEQPRKMYLLDLGRHTRLALGVDGGEFVEYGYGEWKWYANLDDPWWRAPAALLWPTEGALGRREWRGGEAESRLLREYRNLVVLELPAEARKVEALAAELDRSFRRRHDRLVRNERYRLDFVPCDRPYWAFNNSNHAVKAWLEAAGHEVSGPGLFARWRLGEPATP